MFSGPICALAYHRAARAGPLPEHNFSNRRALAILSSCIAGPIHRDCVLFQQAKPSSELNSRIRDVKNFRWWPVIGLVMMSVALFGCGSGDNNANSSLRVVNATDTHASIDMIVDAGAPLVGTLTDAVSVYVAPAAGSTAIQINDTTTGAVLTTSVPSLTGGLHYAVVVYETGGTVQSTIVNEDFAVPALGSATLRFVNSTPQAGNLDIYVTPAGTANLSGVSAPNLTFSNSTSSVPIAVSPTTTGYVVFVTAAGNKSDVRAQFPVAAVADQEFLQIVLTPASGGALINASLLIQQGAYSSGRNTNVRMRMVGAVPGVAKVGASASNGTTTIVIDDSGTAGAGVTAPAFGHYKLVPAGTTQAPTSLNVTVGGASVGAPSTAGLIAGSDYTLIVYGAPAVATLITDDNRPPTDTTKAKVSVINGITGNVGPITLTANSSLIGSGIAPGTASGYTSVPVSSAATATLVLTSTEVSGVLATNNLVFLNPGSVYTILAGGDIGTPASITLQVQ